MNHSQKWTVLGIAVAGTALVHLALFGIFVLWVIFTAATQIIQEEDPQALTITILDSPEPKSTPAPPPLPPPMVPPAEFIRTTAEQASDTPVKSALESDRDTKAATEDKAYEDGLADMSSVKAKKQDWTELSQQKFGPDPGKQLPDNPPPKKAEPTQKPEPPKPTPPPPEPTLLPLPTPIPSPQPTQKPLPTPNPDALALLEKKPKPTPPPPPKPTSQTAKLSPNPPSKAGGNPSERVASEVHGTISRQGKTAVDTTATPMGKYKAKVATIIEERWQYFVRGKIDFVTIGSLRVRFFISPSGKVQNLQLLENSSNEAFASFTYRAITDADLPPIPEELYPLLERGRIEMEYNFILVAQ